jgi:hypothetical protein
VICPIQSSLLACTIVPTTMPRATA